MQFLFVFSTLLIILKLLYLMQLRWQTQTPSASREIKYYLWYFSIMYQLILYKNCSKWISCIMYNCLRDKKSLLYRELLLYLLHLMLGLNIKLCNSFIMLLLYYVLDVCVSVWISLHICGTSSKEIIKVADLFFFSLCFLCQIGHKLEV